MSYEKDYLNQYPNLNIEGIKQARKKANQLLFSTGNEKLFKAYENIKNFSLKENIFNQDLIKFGKKSELNHKDLEEIKKELLKLNPWRTGPFSLAGMIIDAEWQSFLKWNRIKTHLIDIKNKKVCDLGASSGYHIYRLLGLNPNLVIGLDPMPRCYWQFHSLQKFCLPNQAYYEAFGWQELTSYHSFFDLVLCMGILYHHQNPIQILKNIYQSLNKEGQIIIESQGIEGEKSFAFFPEWNYAKARTYFLPTEQCLVNWCKRAHFKDIQIIAKHQLNTKEQRQTQWSPCQSLKDFLSKDKTTTIEGYPPPLRIYVKAKKY